MNLVVALVIITALWIAINKVLIASLRQDRDAEVGERVSARTAVIHLPTWRDVPDNRPADLAWRLEPRT